jgi:hypothetical protein
MPPPCPRVATARPSPPRAGAGLALALAALLPTLAVPAEPGDPITAVRLRGGSIQADGRLEEPAWADAVPFDAFGRVFPDDGGPPSERTEVRVLYDDRALYVGVTCRDSQPSAISRPLGRRDSPPFSDEVDVAVDSMRGGKTAYVFVLTAAGVQQDGLLLGDDFTSDWDAVWDGAAASLPDGWTAEFVIPLAVLRFSDAPAQAWRFGVRRVIARTREEVVSFRMRRSDREMVAHLAELQGVTGVRPVGELSLAPYLATRLSARPQFDDDTRPTPRLLDPTADLGLDLRTSLGSGLTLQGTLNPDFGQVEADQLIQNLTTFEAFFPEKRPFFTQGMDLFAGVKPGTWSSPQQLFYSRRIGLDAPILGAAKLTGRLSDTLQVGLVDALVAGAGAPAGSTEADPVRAYRFAAAQPLHFGPAGSLPDVAPATRHFLAAVARWQPSPLAQLGATVTSALPIGPRCTAAEADLDDPPARCEVQTGTAAALDLSLRTASSDWYLRGQLTGSQALGPDPSRTLPDGTVLARGDLGAGGFLALGKAGGEPWRFDLEYEHQGPRLDLNALGFQRTQNEQVLRGALRYVRLHEVGPFHSIGVTLRPEGAWTTDGRGLLRGGGLYLSSELQLKSFHWLGVNAQVEPEAWDVREVSETGIAQRRFAGAYAEAWVSTDRSHAAWVEGGVGTGVARGAGPVPTLRGWGVGLAAAVRPHDRVETRLELHFEDSRSPARFIEEDGAGSYLFGDLHVPYLSVTLRQQLVLGRRLTLQGYAQLFAATGHYGRLYTARPAGDRIAHRDLVPGGTPSEDPDFREVALNLNVVLRWEYRLGSTLYLVYTRSQAEPGVDGEVPTGLAPRSLAHGPTVDTGMVKWTWFWAG